MPAPFLQSIVCFIVCHAGPADHFATFAQNLPEEIKVEVYACGPALKKLQERNFEAIPFSVDNVSSIEEDFLANQIANICSKASVVITDVGHPFDIKLQKALARFESRLRHLAYYDNPEPFVPGGYSTVACQVMLAAQGILFANSRLAQFSIFEEPDKEVDFGNLKKFGIGYYPLSNVEKIAKRRANEHFLKRQSLLSKENLIENSQKIIVYFGGNNTEYFSFAFPTFLSILSQAIETTDLSNLIFVLQQHPGAKAKNVDAKMALEWLSKYQNEKNAPKFIISDFNSDEAQVLADAAFYYQTSMGPQFVLAGIPTVQIGHETYHDILVRNHLSPSVIDTDQFLDILKGFIHQQPEMSSEVILEALGIRKNWLEILEETIRL